MHEVAIIGAGELGGALAHVLARRDIAAAIRLIDSAGSVAAGKALDIMQASPIERFATRVSGATDVSCAAGAAIVVITDRAGHDEWSGADAMLLITRLSRFAGRAIVICAGASQREVVERGVADRRFPSHRLFGSAPEALVAALKSVVALETNGSARDVALTLLGVPPLQTVIPWESATIGGFLATDVLSEPIRRRIETKVAPLWPPGPHALATAAAHAISGIISGSGGMMSCFVAPEATERHSRAAALPVRLALDGAMPVELPELDARARTALETALRT